MLTQTLTAYDQLGQAERAAAGRIGTVSSYSLLGMMRVLGIIYQIDTSKSLCKDQQDEKRKQEVESPIFSQHKTARL